MRLAWIAQEILVTRSNLEEKNTLMIELKNKVDELALHNEYQLRLKDMNYSEKIKVRLSIITCFCAQIFSVRIYRQPLPLTSTYAVNVREQPSNSLLFLRYNYCPVLLHSTRAFPLGEYSPWS